MIPSSTYCKECGFKIFSTFYKEKGICPNCLEEDTITKELEERLSEMLRMKEKDIIYESGSFWVAKHPAGGWTIYKARLTHSTSTDTFPENRDGLSVAIKLCAYRAKEQLTSAQALDMANKHYKIS